MKVPVKTMAVISALTVLFGITASAKPAVAGVSVGISVSASSLGLYQEAYPELVLVPGYPVYYAPRVPANYFFYDGQYWVYQDDQWYVSDWYNGPWEAVSPDDVPLFVLRVPVGYYLAPPPYFQGWALNAPPRWGYYWGPRWARHRHGWDHWNRHVIPAPAPLPVYQRSYSGHRYPGIAHQRALHDRHYRYHRREAARHHHQPAQRQARNPAPAAAQGGSFVPRTPPPQRPRENVQRPAPVANAAQSPGTINPVRRPRPPQEFSRREPPALRNPAPQHRHQNAQSPFSVRTPQPISAPAAQMQRVRPGPQAQHGARPHARQPQAARESGSSRRHAGQNAGGMQQRSHNRGQGRR